MLKCSRLLIKNLSKEEGVSPMKIKAVSDVAPLLSTIKMR
jgi:hypothetical protein